MKEMKDKEQKESHSKYSLTNKGRRFLREERFMEGLSGPERKAYEECMALLQGISDNGGLEEACEWLEKYASERRRNSDS